MSSLLPVSLWHSAGTFYSKARGSGFEYHFLQLFNINSTKSHQEKLECIDVHDHVQSCPICSRFFKNENTVYIIVIIILAIICILLLKRVLNL